MPENSSKKVVHVDASRKPATTSSRSSAAASGGAGGPEEPPADWTPTPEAKGRATRFRWIAVALWVVAIAAEAFAIFWLLKQKPFTTGHLIGLIGAFVVIGVLSSVGSVLWKKANRLDPARRSDTVRFFVQNQLGAIIAIIAFVPLIILVFTNKNMDGKQKAIAGSIGIVLAAVAAFVFGADYNPPSVEQYTAESNIVKQLTGSDEVFWTKSGSVFHVCQAVPDVNKTSKDNQIYQGTVAAAHDAGKSRLTMKWESEATKYCGYTQAQVDAVKTALPGDVATLNGEPADSSTDAPVPTSTP
ncbi:hypothetical protein [Microbacterium sp. 22242]|uniref:hypothetical protein n=1 Tax=Microbacterium sp. 22242 TaxID=3453896 RepID=UPI003F87A2B3